MSIEVIVQNKQRSRRLKLLRRQVSREAVFRVLQDHAHYSKPSEERKRKIGRAESRRRKSKARWTKKLLGDER